MITTTPIRTQWKIWVVVWSIFRSNALGSAIGAGGIGDHGTVPDMPGGNFRP
jgi:hypothetical protein